MQRNERGHNFENIVYLHALTRSRFVLNPLVKNGLSHRYHLGESIFIFRGIRSNFSFLFHFR